MLTFHEYKRRWPDFPGHMLLEAFTSLSQSEQDECWSDLARWCRARLDDEHQYERVAHGYEEPPPRRRTPSHGTPRSTSTGTIRVQFDPGDPLKSIPAELYLEALAGVEVSSSGRVRCPMPDHEDLHPSGKVYGSRWICFSCGAGGSIIDLGAALYGIPATGRGYWEIRDRLIADLEGVRGV